MAYENKTVDDVYNIFYNGLVEKFGKSFKLLPKSFIHILCKVMAGVFVTGYRVNGWWGLQQYPEYAYYGEVECLGHLINPLKELGNLYGAGEPYTAEQWAGAIKVKVVQQGGYLRLGTQLKNMVNGKIYITDKSVALDEDYVTVDVKCSEGGSIANLVLGDKLVFVSPLGNVDKNTEVVSVTKDGTDGETESEYRSRVVLQFATKPHGGSYEDYREWASDVPGVLQTYIYGDCEEISGDSWTSTGVIIYVAGVKENYPDRIPDKTLLKLVGEACTYDPSTKKMRKMIGQVIDPDANGTYKNIKPVSVRTFDVEITGLNNIDLADFTTDAKSVLTTYFEGREPYINGLSNGNEVLNRVSVHNVLSTINELCVSKNCEFDEVLLSSGDSRIKTYTLSYGELCRLGKLKINGNIV